MTISAGARRRSLEKLRSGTSGKGGGGPLVMVDDAKFDRYVTGVPRQYDAVVFFTAAAPSYQCTSCKPYLEEFTFMAESYWAAKADSPEFSSERDVYFFVADFSVTQGAFQRLGLRSVPKIMHFPPTLSAEGHADRYAVDESQLMQTAGQPQAEAISRFVKEKTGVSVPIVRPGPPVTEILCVLAVLAILAIKPVLNNLGAILRTIRNKYLWLSVSLMVYTFGISGGVYDIIRNPDPFRVRQDGSIAFFHPQANAQFVAEGFITGTMTLLCGMLGILMGHVAPKLKSTYQTVAIGISGMGFLLMFFNVMSLYKSKNPWYRPVF